ncbi:DNA replication and repair protein RecF [Bacteroidia bacterium]|nr:DNA replication and repair protein RecF [Bacteroidia bacterium]
MNCCVKLLNYKLQLSTLSIHNFKNITQLEVVPSPKLTCIVGNNGEGKTNLLDAIYMLSMCKSSVGLTDRQCICYGEDFFVLKGVYSRLLTEETIICGMSKNDGKSIKRNGKTYDKLSEHIGWLPLVMISPADSVLISDSGEERRRYMNGVLAQMDSRYLSAINRYNALLAQRNKMLKMHAAAHYEVIEALDVQLSQYGQQVYEFRTQLAAQLQTPFVRYYQAIAQDTEEEVSLHYLSDLQESTLPVLLQQQWTKDCTLQYTTAGIHRDDLQLKMGGHLVRKLGSQGQQKTMLLALKLAQADILQQRLGMNPILLLDDIFDKLDTQRIRRLIHLVATENFGQIFLTDSNKERVQTLLQEIEEHKLLEMKGGKII